MTELEQAVCGEGRRGRGLLACWIRRVLASLVPTGCVHPAASEARCRQLADAGKVANGVQGGRQGRRLARSPVGALSGCGHAATMQLQGTRVRMRVEG